MPFARGNTCAVQPQRVNPLRRVGAPAAAAAFSPSDVAGLTGYWKLGEGDGLTRADSTANALNLSDHATVTQAVGKVGNAAHCAAASSQYLSRNSEANLQTGDIDVSFACWIYIDSFMASSIIAGKGVEWFIDMGVAGKTPRMVVNASGASIATWGADLSLATWYYVVGYRDKVGGKTGIVVNAGTPVETAYATAPVADANPFALCALHSGALFFDGRVDEAGFWKSLLTTGNIASLYNGGAGTTIP